MTKIIIYDSDHPHAVENRCFTKEYFSLSSFNSFTYILAESAQQNGFLILTGDVFLTLESPSVAFLITDMHSRNTEKIIKKGAIPLICFSMESPLIARSFYINITKLAGRYLHNIQFRGALDRLTNTKTEREVMYYPTADKAIAGTQLWSERRLLTMVNRNKRMFRTDFSNAKAFLISILSYIRLGFQKSIDPWIRSPEIYKDRIIAIKHFSANNSFDLFGEGWNNSISGFGKEYSKAAQKAYRGSILSNEKLITLSKYKFVLCFENCIFPGYITEKIFDCFLAGAIPIYYGAPDIKDFVPGESFVNFRHFNDFGSLEKFLEKMTYAQASVMLSSASSFINSKEFEKHQTTHLVDKMMHYAMSYVQ